MPRTRRHTVKRNGRKNKSSQKNKSRQRAQKRSRGKGGGFWSTKPAAPVDPNAPPPPKKSEGFSSASHFADYAKGSLKASRSAMNMPLTLATMNYKINALMVKNGVNYKFSNGYTAKDYSLDKVPGDASNEGRGELKPSATRGKITGFQSAAYTKTTETDTYKQALKKKDEMLQKKSNPPGTTPSAASGTKWKQTPESGSNWTQVPPQ